MFNKLHLLVAPAAFAFLATVHPVPASAEENATRFNMVVSGGAKACLPNASASVTIIKAGAVEILELTAEGLPPHTDFDFFVLQVPKAPFGVAWYQGDLVTDKHGRAHQRFLGRFSVETFAVAPGSAPAPNVFNGPFPDATINPAFNPIQMYHLGLWFDSPQDAQTARCPATVTPFNGEHNAGIQVLNTSNFPDDHGPLRTITSQPPKPADKD